MLTFNDVCLDYGSFRALHGITLHAGEGELVVLLGANGAGKSSIFRAASALTRASAGHIRLKGVDLVGKQPADVVRAGVVHCPEGRKLFPGLSVLKNLMLGAYTHRRDRAGNRSRLDEVFALFPALEERKDDAAGALSGGQQQMVAIGRALMSRPRVLLLDEPSLGLAPLIVKQTFEVIQRINRAGTTVLLAEQNAHAALKIAHRAYVVEAGRIVLEGTYESLAGNEAVRRAYVGG
ncbi:MAG: ABC transporter ATP-binding protein [Paraburkholderia sp.]|uniref:ABC transporter ATP-binding protein n=1 Tax=Paraburkholderia sp. TaxID=1926495 RepID=UPI001227DD1D|nr:ABC transporter ATP-binding protein [Paraburkholderia sp.]TAM03871.1 MAG: ABC transporter ATP-binding protein [Paraburkholderia sp.]TAM31463.1 MAG: ABC transporter ATP-binding protein [Paraburkholderia sp.]